MLGTQTSGIPPDARMDGLDSRGRPFPVFSSGHSAVGLCGLKWGACDVRQSTRFRNKSLSISGRSNTRPFGLLRDSPTQPAFWGGGGAPAGTVLARLPLPGPQRMAFVVLARAFHKPSGKCSAGAEEAGGEGARG
jgi:hypothetical protein